MRGSLATTLGALQLLLDDSDEGVRAVAAEGLSVIAAFVPPDEAVESVTDADAEAEAAATGMRRIEISADSEDEEEDEDGDEDGDGEGKRGGGRGGTVLTDMSATELPPPTLARVLASSLRGLLGPLGLGGADSDSAGLGASPLAQTVRTLGVLHPAGVEKALLRLEPPSDGSGEAGGVLMAGVLVPRLAALTPAQRTYKEELGPAQELHRELLDHCALLSSLPAV
jgi:hypothetical protein